MQVPSNGNWKAYPINQGPDPRVTQVILTHIPTAKTKSSDHSNCKENLEASYYIQKWNMEKIDLVINMQFLLQIYRLYFHFVPSIPLTALDITSTFYILIGSRGVRISTLEASTNMINQIIQSKVFNLPIII